MKMYFFRGKVRNFGDELNTWLLPKVFPTFFDDDDSQLFLGIGSVIWDTHPDHCEKIVFGSGYGGYTPLPDLTKNWKFYCVRGPRTASACGLSPDSVAGDAAILTNLFRTPTGRKIFRYSFMPHWETVLRGHWQEACHRAGIHFIDPRKPVEEVLADIEGSSVLISEAMHGAIVADALRVPWIPILPFNKIHRIKWFDWAEALDMRLSHHKLSPSSTQEGWATVTGKEGSTIAGLTGVPKSVVKGLDWSLVRLAAESLKRATRYEPKLSSDVALTRAVDRLQISSEKIQRDFRRSPIDHMPPTDREASMGSLCSDRAG